jgi:hypothetical protein
MVAYPRSVLLRMRIFHQLFRITGHSQDTIQGITMLKETAMKKFLILHKGFEKPTEEEMAKWNKWFGSISDIQVERAHLPGGREISSEGTKDMPFGADSITGYTMIKAENLDEAVAIAEKCPFVLSTRVYEIMGLQSFRV